MRRSGVVSALSRLMLAGVGFRAAALGAAVELPAGFSVPGDFKEDRSRRRYWDFETRSSTTSSQPARRF